MTCPNLRHICATGNAASMSAASGAHVSLSGTSISAMPASPRRPPRSVSVPSELVSDASSLSVPSRPYISTRYPLPWAGTLATCTDIAAPASSRPETSTLSAAVTSIVRPDSGSSQRSTVVATTVDTSVNSPRTMQRASTRWPKPTVNTFAPDALSARHHDEGAASRTPDWYQLMLHDSTSPAYPSSTSSFSRR